MAEERFGRLEPKAPALPEKVASAISRLDRFGQLEIAGAKPAPAPSAPVDRLLCPRCGQPNEKARDICWACFKPLIVSTAPTPAAGQEIELMLNGVSYRSSDPTIPADVRAMMDRIRREGYQPDVLQEWANRLAAAAPAPDPAPKISEEALPLGRRIQVIDGKYIDIIRLDDTVYRSDERNLPMEVREIFDYIDKEGVTPALMQHLRLYGTKVRYRPATSIAPSDGDHSFWDAVRRKFNERQNNDAR